MRFSQLDISTMVGIMGAPLIFQEKLGGYETSTSMAAFRRLYKIGHYHDGCLGNKGIIAFLMD